MEAILRGAVASPWPRDLKLNLVKATCKTIPDQPENSIPSFLALGLEWCCTGDAIAGLDEFGLIVMRSLALHVKMELRLPATFVELVLGTVPDGNQRETARRVRVLAALAPVVIRTPAVILSKATREKLVAAVVQFLVGFPSDPNRPWDRNEKGVLGRVVALSLWASSAASVVAAAAAAAASSSATVSRTQRDDGSKDHLDHLLVSVFLAVIGPLPDDPGAHSWLPPSPALGLIFGSLPPMVGASLTPSLLANWPRTPVGDSMLARAVEVMASWPLGGLLDDDDNNHGCPKDGRGGGSGSSGCGDWDWDSSTSSTSLGGNWQGSSAAAVAFDIKAPHTAEWVTAFLLGLGATNRHAALLAAIPAAAAAAAAQLIVSVAPAALQSYVVVGSSLRPALELLERLLWGHQHGPHAFHAVIPALITCAHRLVAGDEGAPSNSSSSSAAAPPAPSAAATTAAAAAAAALALPRVVQDGNNEDDDVVRSQAADATSTAATPTAATPTAASPAEGAAAVAVASVNLVVGDHGGVWLGAAKSLGELCVASMSMHPGHPDKYGDLEAALVPLARVVLQLKPNQKQQQPQLVAESIVGKTISTSTSELGPAEADTTTAATPPLAAAASSAAAVTVASPDSLTLLDQAFGCGEEALDRMGKRQAAQQAWLSDELALALQRGGGGGGMGGGSGGGKASLAGGQGESGATIALGNANSKGLRNLGNTCYLNSLLQCLACNGDLRRLLLPTPPNPPNPPQTSHTPPPPSAGTLVGELRRSLAVLAPGSTSMRRWFSPRPLHTTLPPPFNTTSQQDSAELLRLLLERLEAVYPHPPCHSSIIRKKCSGRTEGDGEGAPQPKEHTAIGKSGAGRSGSIHVAHGTNSATTATTTATSSNSSTTSSSSNSKSNYGRSIEAVFTGFLENRVVCRTCKSVSSRREPFSDLCLPLTPTAGTGTGPGPGTTGGTMMSLEGLLDRFLSSEAMEGEDAYACETCQQAEAAVTAAGKTAVAEEEKDEDVATQAAIAAAVSESSQLPSTLSSKQPADRTTVLTSAPAHLVISFSRFHYDYRLGKRLKINDPVTFPLTFNLPVEMKSNEEFVDKETQTDKEKNGVVDDKGSSLDCAARASVDTGLSSGSNGLREIRSGRVMADDDDDDGNNDGNNSSSADTEKEEQEDLLETPQLQCSTTRRTRRRTSPANPAGADGATSHASSLSSVKTTTSVRGVGYGLYGIIVHAGRSAQAGHYYSYATESDSVVRSAGPLSTRTPKEAEPLQAPSASRRAQQQQQQTQQTQQTQQQWCLYNDESVVEVPSALIEAMGDRGGVSASDTPYILLYRRLDNDMEPTRTELLPEHNQGKESSEQLPSKEKTSVAVCVDPVLTRFLAEDNAAFQREEHAKRVSAPALSQPTQRFSGGGNGGGGVGGGGGGFSSGMGLGGQWGM